MKHIYLGVFALFCTTLFGINTQETLYSKIAQENLKSLITVDADSSAPKQDKKKFPHFLESRVQEQIYPAPEVKRRLAFTLLSHYEKKHQLKRESVLDDRSWLDLEMLCGPALHPRLYLAARIDRTSTEVGRLTLFRKIVQPTADIQMLIRQQEVIREFINNIALFNELDDLLNELVIPESVLFSFWDEKDIFKNILEKESVKLPFQDRYAFLKSLAERIDTDPYANEVLDKLYFIHAAIRGTSMAVGAVTLPLYGISLIAHKELPYLRTFNEKLGIKGALSTLTVLGALYHTLNWLYPNKFAEGGENITAGLAGGLAVPNIHRHVRVAITFNNCLQEKLQYVAIYFSTLKRIHALIACDSNLQRLLPEFYELWCKPLTPELEQLFKLLSTDTFKGEPSFFSLTGRVIAAYKLLYLYKDQLIDMLAAIGELDMHMSVARLYKECKHEKIRFCFPEYNTQSASPFISIRNFWNPLIKRKRVVSNSVVLGTQGERRNGVITGPNAGGKSTILKGIIISIILAQSIGIAPAKELSFTPFSSITTYLNIVDDTAAGNSLFKAGVIRAHELLTRVENLKDNEFALTAVDEVFNGTTYQEGQAAAYTLLKKLGNHPQTLCVTATHYPLITRLETETESFTNYKVSVEEDNQGKIQYPYKLERGVSNQVITFKLLQEEGFSNEFLAEAQKALEAAKCSIG